MSCRSFVAGWVGQLARAEAGVLVHGVLAVLALGAPEAVGLRVRRKGRAYVEADDEASVVLVVAAVPQQGVQPRPGMDREAALGGVPGDGL